MTVYVSIPQVPLTLKFEESMDEVAAHLQELVEGAKVHRYHLDNGAMVLVAWGVIQALTINEGPRTLELDELNRGLRASVQTIADG
ncbi:hypothetical protein [Actinomycetospora termitidis]|uniref:Cell division protein ZapA n=1 Tax=Actinomycetospora termitidis TaxID=3053470 RepID=A0ABT7M8G9_9PSEU|nr:hypothetical protein [Actinomycetospora sp. Odt1-22]MDL5156960.1 hypothetical protein [Actinomycetospora sp. Odt1-22]